VCTFTYTCTGKASSLPSKSHILSRCSSQVHLPLFVTEGVVRFQSLHCSVVAVVPGPHVTEALTTRTVSEGFVGDLRHSIMLTICHMLHSVSHWPVLLYFIITPLSATAAKLPPNTPPCRAATTGFTNAAAVNRFDYAAVALFFSASAQLARFVLQAL
jgi:hypothetical protein